MKNKNNKEIEKEEEYFLVSPPDDWKLIIGGNANLTGSGDCGLFVESKTEKEARKYLKNLVKIIKENNFKI